MVRIIITYILPLILPTIMYFAWASWVRKKIAASHAQAQSEDETATAEELAAYDIRAPWFRLILTGVILMIVGLLMTFFLTPKNAPDSVYQPPRLVDGKVIPGHYAAPPK